jgi:alkylation response protein AidB-like acyl-CoA dehydrogenase
MTVEYAKTRVQFDMPIGIHQHVQAHCVSLVGDVDTSRLVTYLALWRFKENMLADLEVAIAKAWSGEAYRDGCWHAHHVLAGVGSAERLSHPAALYETGQRYQLLPWCTRPLQKAYHQRTRVDSGTRKSPLQAAGPVGR